MFNLILFGPPGSGKGTQSEKLIAKYGLKHLSTGDILRSEIAGKTDLGLKAKSFMDAGQLVPDAVVIGMVDAAISVNKGVNGFLFDGFPRTKAQAEALDELLKSHSTEIHVVLALDVPEEELIQRMIGRAKTSEEQMMLIRRFRKKELLFIAMKHWLLLIIIRCSTKLFISMVQVL